MTTHSAFEVRLDHDCTLTITIPEIADALALMRPEEKARMVCYMASDEDLFDKVVDILADGFCTPETDEVPDWRYWFPGSHDKARERLLSKMPDVIDRRVADLERDLRSLQGRLDLAETWSAAYREAHERHHARSGDAHAEASDIVRRREQEATDE